MDKVLSQHINFPIVFRIIGWLLMIEAGFMLLPAVVSWNYNECMVMRSFLGSAAITFVFGALMTFGLHPHSSQMRRRDGILLTVVTWLSFSLFAMLPFLLSQTLTSVVDAFFETVSGFSTTGATVIRDVDGTAHGILFWRALMHWIGGMGIILFTLAVLPMLNHKGGIALFNAEMSGITHERLRPRVSQTAKYLWGVYLGLTVAQFILLVFGPMGWFDALCHTMSTVSTGGFSTRSAGVNFWDDRYSNVVITIFMFLGGTNIALLFAATREGPVALWLSETFRCYFAEVVIVAVIIFLCVAPKGPIENWGDRLLFSFFNTVSATTSTGFSIYSYEQSGQFVLFLLMLTMFFGSMAGSTSGAAKIDRMIVMFKNTRNELYRMLHPNAVMSVRVDGKSVPHYLVAKVIAFVVVYAMMLVSVALLLTLLGIPVFDSLFASFSALGNIGMGYGITGELGSFALIPDLGKLALSFEMMAGRLELFTVLVLFTPSFWVKD